MLLLHTEVECSDFKTLSLWVLFTLSVFQGSRVIGSVQCGIHNLKLLLSVSVLLCLSSPATFAWSFEVNHTLVERSSPSFVGYPKRTENSAVAVEGGDRRYVHYSRDDQVAEGLLLPKPDRLTRTPLGSFIEPQTPLVRCSLLHSP